VNVNNEYVVSVPIEEAWKAMFDLERITAAAQGRDQLYVVLALAQRFTCKQRFLRVGDAGIEPATSAV
jgi:hypothetical protein